MRAPEAPTRPTTPAVLRRAADEFGDRTLLVMPTERLTFAEADERSRLLARRLVAAGVGKATRVGIHAPYGADTVVALLAATRIGALAAPLSTASTPAELRSAIRRADIDTVLAPGPEGQAAVSRAVPGLGAAGARPSGAPYLRQVLTLGDVAGPGVTAVDRLPMVEAEVLEAIEAEVTPADLFVLIQTSGSTAEPKGVLHTHGTALRKTSAPLPGPLFLAMPFFWVGGLAVLCGALQSGTTLVCQERFEPGEALDLMEQHEVALVGAWPTVVDALRNHPTFDRRDLRCRASLGGDGGVPAYSLPLGMTETFGPHTAFPHPELGMDPPPELRGSLGVSAPHLEHRLVDPESGEPVEGEGEGELCVRGYAVAAGLYKREREEFVDAEGWFHTGDLVARRAGLWWFVGRCTEMIKVRGANVAPPEVEAALVAIPGVKHAFVLGVPHPRFEQQVAAVIVPEEGVTLAPEDVRAQVALRLSAYKVPSLLLALDEDEVPWLGTGKPDKRALSTRFP